MRATPHLLVGLKGRRTDPVHFATIALPPARTEALLDAVRSAPSTLGPDDGALNLAESPARVRLYHEDVTGAMDDILVVAAFAHTSEGKASRLIDPAGVLPAGVRAQDTHVIVNRRGMLRWFFVSDDEFFRSHWVEPATLALASAWHATEAELPARLAHLARIDPTLALDTIERGLALYRIGARRPVPNVLPADEVVHLLTHPDDVIRTRAVGLLSRALV